MFEINENNQPELIRDLPAAVRPVSRLAALGTEALKEQELLALVLHSRSLRALEELLAKHQLKDLLGMPFARLSSLRGIGNAGAAALLAAAELTRRSDKSGDEAIPVLRSVSDVVAQAMELRDKKKEHLLAFFLNARHQLIAKEVISIGTLTASLAHPREIFLPAIGKSAAGLILVHNHPSGDPTPSDEDNRLTKRVAQAGVILGIELLDHVIVAEKGCYSYKTANNGVLA
jgi:DNA repair protein RadC